MEIITPEEIEDLASRYIEVGKRTFPVPGELFYFQIRKIPQDRLLNEEEDWQFMGYAQLLSYVWDDSAKPRGRWLFLNYLDLSSYPPQNASVRLQPPHIVLGKYQTPDRAFDIRLKKVESMMQVHHSLETTEPQKSSDPSEHTKRGKILKFPSKSKIE